MRKRNIILTALLTVTMLSAVTAGSFMFSGCSKKEAYADNLMLHLAFDENSGNKVKDSSNNLPEETVQYVYNDAKYKATEDPQWRAKGVVGGSLLFDGYTNTIRYGSEDIKASGSSFTVSAYIAPRAFEWDDPNAKTTNDGPQLTSIVSQYTTYTASSGKTEIEKGFILGYWRYGELCFRVGTADDSYTVWSGEHKLEKYAWNYVVAEFDGPAKEIRLYLNGELVGSEEMNEESPEILAVDGRLNDLCIGSNSKHPTQDGCERNMVSGLLDEVKLYNTVLPESEIKSVYEKNGRPEIAFEDIWLQNILTDDEFKTQYHGGPYQMWMNEPHAPFYYNGVYHLFFQFNMFGPYFRQLCWGHLTSTDMVNWTPRKEVITPTEGSVCPDGVWSGGSTLDKNGVPILFFTAGNDSFRSSGQGLISNQNIGYAYPKDLSDPLLTEWVVGDELAIKQQTGQGRTGEFRDAHVWKEDGVWYMTVCSGTSAGGGTALLYTATTLEYKQTTGKVDMNWQYRGEVYSIPNQSKSLGSTWELPVILPISNEAGTITKHVFMISPAPASSADNKIYYFIGNLNKTTYKFEPDTGWELPRIFDYGTNIFTGPSAFIAPDGEMYMFSIMQDKRNTSEVPAAGWANCVGLARRIWLNDDGTDVKCDVVSSLRENYTTNVLNESNLTLSEANAKLENCDAGDMYYLKAKIKNKTASSFGITVKSDLLEGTRFTYSVDDKTIKCAPNSGGSTLISTVGSGQLEIEDSLTIEIYVDRSMVEAFFNNDKAISTRSYSPHNWQFIKLFATDGEIEIEELTVSKIKSIY